LLKKVLVVGLGSIGKRHVRNIRKLFPDVEIIVFRHKKCNKKNELIAEIDSCVTTISEAIDKKPQAAIIANPANMHLNISFRLANKGIHLLIEKPISNSSKNIQDLISVCENNGIVLMTAYNLRFSPSLIEFREQIQNNCIGRIFSVRSEVGQYLPSWRASHDYRKSVSAQKKLGGGVLLELSHEIDYISWVFGSIKWVKSHISKVSNLEIDVEDNSNIIFGIEDEFCTRFSGTLNMDFIRLDSTRKCTVIGENGTLCWDGIMNTVKLFSEKEKKWELLFSSKIESNYMYEEEIRHFFSRIEDKNSPLITGLDGLNAVLAVEAIQKSSDSGKMTYI